MKRIIHLSVLAAGLSFAGCIGGRGPYYNVDSWYVRQNAVPQYFAPYDVFYMFSEPYDDGKMSITNRDFTVKQTELFGKKVRVFAPLCRDADDAETALDWYLDNYHDPDRPFVFLGEGEGAKLLEPLIDGARGKGLVGSFLSEERTPDGFVTPELVDRINERVRAYLHRREWEER
jgi:hypothetical protein